MPPDASARASRRLSWLAGIVLLWGVLILAKLVLLQVVRHQRYLEIARRQQEKLVEIPAPRGSIYDRNGHPLAMSVTLESVSVNPRLVPDVQVAASIISSILELDPIALYGRLKQAGDFGRGFLWVKRKIPFQQAQRLRSLRLNWITLQPESQRHYPNGRLAANVLGSVDHEEQGNGGIEAALNEDLDGLPGAERLLTDVRRRGIDSRTDTEPHAGAAVILSLDQRIQFAAEREIARAVQEHKAKSGSVVVMNPHNGEIYAMASYPTFDPNKPPVRGDDPASRFNHAVSVPFEPGSVFKVITMTAALETTDLRPRTIINCGGGALTLFGRTIHEASGHGYGSIPMADVLARSSNIGSIQVGLRVGQDRMYEYVRRFGFGSRTGVTLPAESPGRVRPLKIWGATSLASVAIGHEISTTSLQLAQACAVIANGGLIVRPKVVLSKRGKLIQTEAPRRVIQPETAITMRQMMEGVVVLPHGTGKRARLDGYSSGGKTGTAVIYDYATHRYTHLYNGSFIGFAPVPNPAIVIAVTVNGTRGTSGYGGVASAPVFKAVAQEALRVLDIPKDLPDAPEAETKEKEDLNDLSIAELADPEELQETPAAAPAQPPVTTVAALAGPKVPNFQGMTMRAVLAEASARGLPVLVDGTGVARVQQPPPGAPLPPGGRILVRFAR